ncbi:MAG: 50S ribosomal protein L21e [Thermoplasmata archaeon HGW-Thermoplasmata-1]|nr:MAG: 50S ribosomal protein L21e [Thermoplasmata archaeon HGW-Thermoplasmata-1]
MVKRSKGIRSKSRQVMTKRPRQKGLTPITHTLQEFDEGAKVAIVIDPSIHKGMPHPRFQGFTGSVVGKQGGSFIVGIKVGGKAKTLVVRAEHLKRVA